MSENQPLIVKLHPHQLKAIEEIKNGSVVKGGVGVGKSHTAIGYFFTKVCGGSLERQSDGTFKELERPRDLIVITPAKKRDELDWEGVCASFRLSKERAVSHSQVQVTVDSWNNILAYVNVKDAFFIFDEQRLVGSGAWVKAFLKIAEANQWIVLSATPGDTWMDYCPIFIANGFYKNRTEFIRTHVVYNNFSKFPKIDRYVETGRLLNYRKQISVDMPYQRHTKRHEKQVVVPYDKDRFDKVVTGRWNVFEDRPIKDVSELFSVMRRVVNEDPSRLGAVMKIMEKHPRLIVFYNFNYELELLRTLGATLGVTVAEWNGQKHQEIPDGDVWIYLVQYTAGAEAWNCVTTDAIVLYSLNYSWKINEQVRGRIDRMNTPYVDLFYYVLRSTSRIDLAIFRSLATKETFQEKNFKILGQKPISEAKNFS